MAEERGGEHNDGYGARQIVGLAEAIARAGVAEIEATAWLHDVVEDSPVTPTELAEQLPPEVVAAVDAFDQA